MGIRQLIEYWQEDPRAPLAPHEWTLRLSLDDAAKVRALAEMYPYRDAEAILQELVAAALDEVEATLPYVAGERVVAEDELGDPIHEDAGPTPRFQALVRKHRQELAAEHGG